MCTRPYGFTRQHCGEQGSLRQLDHAGTVAASVLPGHRFLGQARSVCCLPWLLGWPNHTGGGSGCFWALCEHMQAGNGSALSGLS